MLHKLAGALVPRVLAQARLEPAERVALTAQLLVATYVTAAGTL